MAKSNIKHGGGADLRSPVYSEMGSLASRPKYLARKAPFRGEKQRTHSRGKRK